MNRAGIRAVVYIVVVLSIILSASYSYSGQRYYAFSLGKHSIEGNDIEFTFPSPPPTKTLYLFNYQWKQKETYKKARLVVNLYDKGRKLIAAGESIWVKMQRTLVYAL